MRKKNVSSADIHSAREFLASKNIPNNVITPQSLASLSKKNNQSLDEVFNLIAFLKTAGVGYGPSPYTAKILTGRYV